MAEKIELPYTLIDDGTGAALVVQAFHPSGPEHGMNLRAVDKVAGTGTTVAPVDPAELMRNLAAFVPEVEPQDYDAAVDGNGNLWSFSEFLGRWTGRTSTGELVTRTADEIKDQTYRFTRLYAHPPVTAEPAPVPEAANAREVIEDILRNDPENRGVPRLFPISAQDVLEALDARGLTVVDARNVVTADPVTAPSVEQMTEVFDRWEVASKHGRASWPLLFADIHALYGIPGDAGDEQPAWRWKYRANMAEARLRELEAAVTEMAPDPNGGNGISWEDRAGKNEALWQEARAEVERYKAALEAADALLSAKDDVDETESEVRRVIKAKDEAIDERDLARASFNEAFDAYSAARAAVEAETIEEAGV